MSRPLVGLALVVLLAPMAAVHASPVAEPAPTLVRYDAFQLQVLIRDALALTHARLNLTNTANVSREIQVQIPLSQQAVLTNISLRTPNGTFYGIVQERVLAQTAYNSSKQRNESAVLIQSAGKGLLSLSVNVAAGQSISLSVRYVETLPLVSGQQKYAFPLEQVAPSASIGRLRIDADLQSTTGWSQGTASGIPAAVNWSDPMHGALHYAATESKAGLPFEIRLQPTLAGYASTFLASGRDRDAAFLLQILPPGSGNTPLPLNVVFVIDRSGSMGGEKIVQAKAALASILGQLRPQDRFGLVRFDHRIESFQTSLRPVTTANIQAGKAWIQDVEADGSTDIEGGVSAALQILGSQESAAVPTVILITDGQPTAGITVPKDIIESLEAKNKIHARIHTVGIGFDQDDTFLGELAASTRAYYQAIGGNENVDSALRGFFDRISTPVLKDVSVAFRGLAATEVHPQPLPDVYEGSHLVLAGRADTRSLPQTVGVVVTGRGPSGPVTFEVSVNTSMPDVSDVSRVWARLKANSIERAMETGTGEVNETTLRAQLLALGLEFQIATLATSWVIVQPSPEEAPPTRDYAPTGLTSAGGGGAPVFDMAQRAGTTAATDSQQDAVASAPGADATPAVKKTPSPGPILALAGIALAFAWLRRRPGRESL